MQISEIYETIAPILMTTEIIIPAYNEAHRIDKTLRDYLAFFGPPPTGVQSLQEVRFTVVLNGCTDRTEDVVRKIQAKFPDRVQIIVIGEPIGKGGSIRAGWQQSTAEVVGFVDADGATPPEEFAKLLRVLPEKDGVIASRLMSGATILKRQGRIRPLMSRCFAQLMRLLFRLPFSDFQCGAKVFRKNIIDRVLPHVRMSDMTFDVDLLWQLQKINARIAEVPTVWIDQPHSASLGTIPQFFTVAFRMFLSILLLRIKTWRRRI